ncbi:MAG TPA: DUF3592 domain-containing protein [Chthonomonadaceae bacterium]|nr:DUF3592 domain-containing protein [Chthonomonadaceae bacterium]
MQRERQQGKTVIRYRTTGRVRVRGSRAANGFLAAIMAGLFLLILWVGYHDLSVLTALQARGRTAYGRITDKRTYTGKSRSYYLYYSFLAGDTGIQSRASVPRSRYYAVRLGDPILVAYLPENPSVNREGIVDASRIHSAELGWSLLFVLFLVFAGLIVWANFVTSRARKAVVRRIL